MSEQSTTMATRSSPRRRKPETIPSQEESEHHEQKNESEKQNGEAVDKIKTNDDSMNSSDAQTEEGKGDKESDQTIDSAVLDDQDKKESDQNDSKVAEVKTPKMPETQLQTANTRVSTRKRRSAAEPTMSASSSSSDAPAAKRRNTGTPRTSTSKKGQKEHAQGAQIPPIINFDDPNDPYNFSTNSNVHPEPLKNISIERSSFGEYKYTKASPSSTDRYANVERIAAGRNPQLNNSLLFGTPTDNPTSLSMMSSDSLRLELTLSANGETPTHSESAVSARSRASKRNVTAVQSSSAEDEFQLDDDDDHQLKTPPKRKSKTSGLQTPEVGMKTPQSARKRGSDWSNSSIKSEKKPDDDFYIVPTLSAFEQFSVDHPKDLTHFLEPGARVLALWGAEYYAANICGREALGRYYVHFVEDNLNRVLPPSGVIPISFLNPGTRLSFIDSIGNEEVGKVSEVVSQPEVGENEKEDPQGWVQGEFEVRELDEDLNPAEETKKVSWSKLFLTKEQSHPILHGKTFNPVVKIDQENIVNESRATRRSRGNRISFTESRASPSPLKTPESTALRRTSAKLLTTPEATKTSSPAKQTPSPGRTRRSGGRSSSRINKSKVVVDEPIEEEPEEKTNTVAAEDESQGVQGTNEKIQTPSPVKKESPRKATPKKETAVEEDPQTVPEMDEEDQKMEMDDDGGNTTTDEAGTPAMAAPTNDGMGTSAQLVNLDDNHIRSPEHHLLAAFSPLPVSPEYGKTPTKDGIMQNMYDSSPSVVDEKSIFNNLKFVLTSANRPNKVTTDFNKREYRTKIEERGGQVVDDFSNVQPDETVYLIADTFYRTHKYLCALSLSIPCISYTWVKECVAQSKLVDFNPFLLPSGESTLEPGQIFPWKPLKGHLFKDMCVVVYSKYVNDDPRATAFDAIWTPLMRNLGAIIVGSGPDEPFSPDQRDSTLEQKLDFCTKNKFDVLLAENDCEKELAENAQAKGALAVSSEWVIQAIVTGELPDVNASEKFRYDFA